MDFVGKMRTKDWMEGTAPLFDMLLTTLLVPDICPQSYRHESVPLH